MIQSNNRPFKNKPLSNIQQAQCLQYAFQIGMIRSNPADRVERPRKEKFKSEIYSGEELEQLFKVIQGDPSEFGVIMAAFYGLRRSEIVGLKWDAIDFENKKISIQHTVVTAKVNGTVTEIARDKTKTKSSCRTLPLIPACEQMLNKMKKEQEQNRKVCGKSYCVNPAGIMDTSQRKSEAKHWATIAFRLLFPSSLSIKS